MNPTDIKRHGHLQTRNADVTVLGMCDVEDALGLGSMDYMEGGKVLMAWCAEHGVHYYARPRDQFFITTAVAEAADKGLRYVVVEDMS